MEKDILSEKDLQNLNKLYDISKDIKMIYKKLSLLEVSGKKETGKYQKLIECLNEMIYLEDKVYDSLNLDFSKCVAWQRYIKDNFLSKKICDDILIDGWVDYFEYRRIYYTINYIGNLKMNNLQDLSMLGIKIEQISFSPNNKTDMMDKKMSLLLKLSNAVDEDYYGTFMMFLEDDINNENNIDIKNEMIYRKYFTSYFYKNIEKIMLKNNFASPKQIYSNSKIIYSLLYGNKDADLIGNDIYFIAHFDRLVKKYLGMKHQNDYCNEEVSKKIIECMLKSKFANMSEETANELCNIIDYLNTLTAMPNVRDNAYKLIDILSNSKQYRERVGIITFGIKM